MLHCRWNGCRATRAILSRRSLSRWCWSAIEGSIKGDFQISEKFVFGSDRMRTLYHVLLLIQPPAVTPFHSLVKEYFSYLSPKLSVSILWKEISSDLTDANICKTYLRTYKMVYSWQKSSKHIQNVPSSTNWWLRADLTRGKSFHSLDPSHQRPFHSVPPHLYDYNSLISTNYDSRCRSYNILTGFWFELTCGPRLHVPQTHHKRVPKNSSVSTLTT